MEKLSYTLMHVSMKKVKYLNAESKPISRDRVFALDSSTKK